MCCSTAPAKFSSTVLYAAAVKVHGKTVHVNGYQNKVENLAHVDGKPGGNAMILPCPAVPGTMTQANIMATDGCPNILKDMERAVMPPVYRGGPVMTLGASRSFNREVVIFESGIYTVLLAQDARAIPDALPRVPREKRPSFNRPLFTAYARWYRNYPILVKNGPCGQE